MPLIRWHFVNAYLVCFALISWHNIQCDVVITRQFSPTFSQQTPHNSFVRARYRLSVVRIESYLLFCHGRRSVVCSIMINRATFYRLSTILKIPHKKLLSMAQTFHSKSKYKNKDPCESYIFNSIPHLEVVNGNDQQTRILGKWYNIQLSLSYGGSDDIIVCPVWS